MTRTSHLSADLAGDKVSGPSVGRAHAVVGVDVDIDLPGQHGIDQVGTDRLSHRTHSRGARTPRSPGRGTPAGAGQGSYEPRWKRSVFGKCRTTPVSWSRLQQAALEQFKATADNDIGTNNQYDSVITAAWEDLASRLLSPGTLAT